MMAILSDPRRLPILTGIVDLAVATLSLSTFAKSDPATSRGRARLPMTIAPIGPPAVDRKNQTNPSFTMPPYDPAKRLHGHNPPCVA